MELWDSLRIFSACLTSICLCFGTFCFILRQYKYRKFPPGPWGLPFVGYLPFLGDKAPEAYARLARHYGPIISVTLGTKTWVVLNDYETIQEALVKNGKAFSGRPKLHLLQLISQGQGIVFKNFEEGFKTQRNFTHKTLRGFGVGKRSMEVGILEEIGYFCDAIKEKNGQPFNCQGSRFAYDDQAFLELTSRLNKGFTDDGCFLGKLILVSQTRFIPSFLKAYSRIIESTTYSRNTLKNMIQEHRQDFDIDNTRSFIDEYLKEMNRMRGKDSSFNELQLFQTVRDLFLGGTEPTSSTMRWCVLSFAFFPKIQEKIAEEVRNIIGDGVPSMQNRAEMPFTCAFIHEILRHRTLLPLSLPHMTTADVTLRGLEIPARTPVLANIWAVHHDPEHFEDPEEFRPERFINSDGFFTPDKHVIPFSVGPRYCIGDQLAKVELFLFVTSIIQKFRIVPDKPLPDFNIGVQGIAEVPQAYKVAFKDR